MPVQRYGPQIALDVSSVLRPAGRGFFAALILHRRRTGPARDGRHNLARESGETALIQDIRQWKRVTVFTKPATLGDGIVLDEVAFIMQCVNFWRQQMIPILDGQDLYPPEGFFQWQK